MMENLNEYAPWIVLIVPWIVILIISLFSPLWIASMNQRHERKMKEVDLCIARRMDVIAEYIKATSEYITSMNRNFYYEYSHRRNMLYYYCDEKAWDLVDTIDQYLKNNDPDSAEMAFNTLCKVLHTTYPLPKITNVK